MKLSRRSRQAGDHVPVGELGAVFADDVCADRLAEQLVGDTDDGRLAHALDRVERVLDLRRAHLLAARLDDVVAASHEYR